MDFILDVLTWLFYAGEAVLVLSSLILAIGARAPGGAIAFLAAQNVAALAMVVGWVLLLPWAARRAWVFGSSSHYPGKIVTRWDANWLQAVWGNWEDGVTGVGTSKGEYLPFASDWWRAYMWSAWRNSANNLRFILRWYGAEGAPFYRYVTPSGRWYFQAGWFADNGFPVLSAGRT
jgi:hypothetical protein